MARVVKPPSGHKRTKCEHCLATVEYAPAEVQRVDGKDISGGPDGHEFIRCPNQGCGKKIILRSW